MDEDDFERLYEQELELMNELAANENLDSSNIAALEKNATDFLKASDKDPLPVKKNLFNESSFCEEPEPCGKVVEVVEQLNLAEKDPNNIRRRLLDDECTEVVEQLNLAEKDPSNIRRRLLDDECTEVNFVEKEPSNIRKRLLHDEFTGTFKRRKSSLPMVGYEITPTPVVDHQIEVIDRILSHRKKLEVDGLSVSSVNERELTLIRNASMKKKCTFHQRIPDGDFQSITTSLGRRLYLEVEDENAFDEAVARKAELKDRVKLLSVPYIDLRMEAEKELLSLNSQLLKGEEMNERAQSGAGTDADVDSAENELWVNKYRPKEYLDLLSDETTNRTVLHWMKLWDKIVYGLDPKERTKHREKAPKAKPKFFSKFAPEILEDLDESGRPQQKAVLLCGPPGLGKTTLAHIIARHAGYNVVEMNASDDRSVDSFRRNLENATSMKSVFGVDKRPNCLVIDEIDGAPAASINLLVNLVQAKRAKSDAATKGKKKDGFVLFRPVICICNDLYVPSLRPLKQISLVIQFPPTHPNRLAQRLQLISQKQRMKTDLSVLLSLCNKTENDIRACLSVLQFVRISSGELKFVDIDGVSVGQKDYQRSLFSVWHDIFTLPRPKREVRVNPHQQHSAAKDSLPGMSPPKKRAPEHQDPTTLASRFGHILKTAQSCGEFEKLTLGWFENYPHMKFKHTHMEPVISGLEWATMTDMFQKEILRSQVWSLGAYIPLSFVAYHFLFASNNWPTLKFPSQYHEHTSNQAKSKSLLDILSGGMSAYTQVFSPKMSLVQDILPYLTCVLQPPLRRVNVQLYSNKEKEELNQLVSTMISHNLTYQQGKNAEGLYFFTLDPNIEDIVNFSQISKAKSMPYSTMQLIAREIELEKVRRSESYFGSKSQKAEGSGMKLSKSSKEMESATKKGEAAAPVVPNHLKKLEAKKVFKTPNLNVIARDFFGRAITSTKADENRAKDNFLNSDIWFKFKEGYSNAVRRPVKVGDFLGPNR